MVPTFRAGLEVESKGILRSFEPAEDDIMMLATFLRKYFMQTKYSLFLPIVSVSSFYDKHFQRLTRPPQVWKKKFKSNKLAITPALGWYP